MTTPATASALRLEPHPEGGWFRRTYTAATPVDTPGGARPAATCIHYLLTPGEASAWHVVTSDEIWLWHGPGALELSLGGSGAEPGEATTVRLGPSVSAGDAAQVLVPAGVWQAARLAGDEECLVSCVVSPGFDFADWRLANARE
ncbi:cupin domain-containing protein [Demequina sp. NBRC 110056]|uniref:cupin domain-containing protein n=1 Tax=Demequina sp. NBRC 110056 TaxID=1570345 RepID=UPI000A0431C0|nr:cupin domain-containing protein [Demequina sp. NBRC 110056]